MILVLFPHQLFEQVWALKPEKVLLVEEPLFFKDPERIDSFATVKLVYTRATMSSYISELQQHDIKVERIEYNKVREMGLAGIFDSQKISEISCYEVADKLLTLRITGAVKQVNWISTPNFLLPESEYPTYLNAVGTGNPYFQTTFYKYMRESRNILMSKKRAYEGGKLTFDSENRLRMPDDVIASKPFGQVAKSDEEHVKEADNYVKRVFGDDGHNYKLLFPVSRTAAYSHLDKFIQERFHNFGPYQDAIRSGTDLSNLVLFHSGISGALNCGLLDPARVLEAVMNMKPGNVKIASLEGFVRQLIGWREFIRFVYETKYDAMVDANQLAAGMDLDERWYKGGLGVPPVDDAIRVAFRSGYLHHIVRLMILANFMTISGIHPHAMYRWFMEFSLDSYDWVMLPNVYGMASYATDLLSTKPYISSSAYVLRMSNYRKDGHWDKLWDALYYDFLFRNNDNLTRNGRMFFMLNNARKKTDKERAEYIKLAGKFMASLKEYSKKLAK